MSTLVWSDTGIARCPSCGSTVVVGIMSLAATCACGMYYVDINGARGWYLSREHYERGDDPLAPGSEPPVVVAGTVLSVAQGKPALCITADDAREIVRITFDGQVIVNPEFTVDEAARAFWEAVQKLAERRDRGGSE